MADRDADYWISALDLEAHREGGHFRETYRSAEKSAGFPERFDGERSLCTSIFYLLRGSEFSAFHRIRADELWHFYAGSSLTLHMLQETGALVETRLGGDPEYGESFFAVLPAGRWFAATVTNPKGFALVGCTVAPGFQFSDFELGKREALIARFPQHAEIIHRLTRVPELPPPDER